MSALQCVAPASTGLHVDTLDTLPTSGLEKKQNVRVFRCPPVCSTLFCT